MGYYVSDLGEAIDEYNLALREHHDGKISEDEVDDAKKEVVRIAQSIYFDNGKFDRIVYQMHKPNGALITVEGGQVYVQVVDSNDLNEIENLHIPSPGPDPF